jgi:UDP-N-acetylmuramate-alanine ligase
VNKVPFYGAAIVCLDDANVQGILPSIKRRTVTYGATAQADVEASEIVCGSFASDFRLRYRAEDLGRFHLRVPGRHNILNAVAAVAVAMELEVPPEAIREAQAAFTGGSRCAARNAALRSSTTTATIPPRSAPRSTAPGCAASGASTCCSNHTGSRGRFT